MAKELKPSEQLIQDRNVIRNHTPFDEIIIEQTNKRANHMQGIVKCHYTPIWDDTEPENPIIDHVNWKKIGGNINFIANPFGDITITGTGRIALLINDDNPVPKHSLSGETTGFNLEFLASHYGEGWFKIIDPEIEKEVKKRYEAIIKAKKKDIKHQFDRRYAVRGIGTVDERVKIEVENPKDVQEMLLEMKKELENARETNKDLLTEIKKIKGGRRKKPLNEEVKEKKVDHVCSFAESE